MNHQERASGLEYAKPIMIGEDVWIGGSVVVCPGVTIGDRSVIGAGSVVTKDIPAGVFAAGNPCRVIRSL
jgi:maltose O-acetyltransferase